MEESQLITNFKELKNIRNKKNIQKKNTFDINCLTLKWFVFNPFSCKFCNCLFL